MDRITTKTLRALRNTKFGVDECSELSGDLSAVFNSKSVDPFRPLKGKLKPALVSPLGDGRGREMKLVAFLLLLLPCFLQSQSDYTPGYAQYQHQQFDSAVVSFTQLITAHPEKKEGYYNRGLSYYQLKKLPQALNDFNTCLQIDSVFDDARFMKTSTLQAMGDWQNAFIEFNKLNTNYAGYKELKKAIRYHNLSVYISRNWYYMIAIMFMFIILAGIVAKSYSTYKG